MRLKFQTGLWF